MAKKVVLDPVTRIEGHLRIDTKVEKNKVVEAYGMTGAEVLRRPAQKAVDFIHQSQNPYLAWRYGVRDGDNDTSVTGCMVAVLRAAKDAELEVDSGSFRGAMGWIEKMTEPESTRKKSAKKPYKWGW